MNFKKSISIIVPVYKAEKYLSRCIDSILNQTFPDFELLLIDDGSPDSSGQICDEYASKDGRIRVFHKNNGGVSSARQLGIEKAVGKYSIHADPDDWVEPDMLQYMYEAAEESGADIVWTDFFVETENQSEIKIQNPQTTDSDVILCHLLSDKLHGSLCNKLIKHSNYLKYDIRFPEHINFMEDKYIVCELLRNGCKVEYLHKAFYHYDCFTNVNSLVRTFSHDTIKQLELFVEHFDRVLDKEFFEEALYRQKEYIKEWIFYENYLSTKDFIDLFRDINDKYILEYKLKLKVIGELGKDHNLNIFDRITFSIYRKCVRRIYRIMRKK